QGLMRALASVGIFRERETGTFENTPLSEILRAKTPGSMRSMALFIGDTPTWNAWGDLVYTVRTGKSAFKHVNGVPPDQYFSKHPEAGLYFNDAFTGFSRQEMDAIHAAFDFSGIKTLVDVGGGLGAMLCSSLARNPEQQGILFDQPHVLGGSEAVIASFGVG